MEDTQSTPSRLFNNAPPLLLILYNLSVTCKGITIILITAHRFKNHTLSATSNADGIFGPFIAPAAAHAHTQAVNVGHLLRKYRTGRLRTVQFEPASG